MSEIDTQLGRVRFSRQAVKDARTAAIKAGNELQDAKARLEDDDLKLHALIEEAVKPK